MQSKSEKLAHISGYQTGAVTGTIVPGRRVRLGLLLRQHDALQAPRIEGRHVLPDLVPQALLPLV